MSNKGVVVLKVVTLNFHQQIRVDGRLDEQENTVN